LSILTGGAAAGWTTKATAIDMLFKKYWKWGGVIEANYKEFIGCIWFNTPRLCRGSKFKNI
jgi:hypothetical protein